MPAPAAILHRFLPVLLGLLLLPALAPAQGTLGLDRWPVANDAATTATMRRVLGLAADAPLHRIRTRLKPDTRHPIEITTDDGVILTADFGITPHRRNAPVVVMVHTVKADRHEFDALALALLHEGFSVLQLDLRGWGGSTRRTGGTTISGPDYEKDFRAKDFAELPKDVGAAVRWLRNGKWLDQSNGLILIGDYMGAAAAGSVAPDFGSLLRGAILISPPGFYRGMTLKDQLHKLQGRPIVCLTPEEDTGVREAIQDFRRVNKDVREVTVPVRGNGVELTTNPVVRTRIVELVREWR